MSVPEGWEIVIGIETHCQLLTESKLFSDAPAEFSADPNLNACEVDLGLPGVLPVPNRRAIEAAIRFGLAVGATVNEFSEFARKNYFYPDLPKGYQISQYEHPILTGGSVAIGDGADERDIRLTRAHLEEDAGKLLHDRWADRSGVDLNRAGVPLLEIVSEPELRTSAEAGDYARRLHQLVQHLDICDGQLQNGSFRCDVNVSVRPAGSGDFGTRCEIKNLNSFRFLQQAIDHEAARQVELIEAGEEILQETRLFDPASGKTRSMRSKEEAQDYRYFPDPDLLPLRVSAEWVAEVRRGMPELPRERERRYTGELGLSPYDASVLTADRDLASYYDATVAEAGAEQAKLCANWVTGEISARLNKLGTAPADIPVSPGKLARLLARVADKTISGTAAKGVLDDMWDSDSEADRIIEDKGLKQIGDEGELEKILDGIIADNPGQFEKLVGGKDRIAGFFVGQAMKATGGKADPSVLNRIVRERAAAEAAKKGESPEGDGGE